ncbi:hypothetical protein BSKO_00321 [Bryopsis sp. KO-2023]|nr:hypothetical protein BSKO_00321 [Bryopsis sp. KO-2023]
MARGVEGTIRELYTTRPGARRRRTYSWSGPLLPIIMEDDLEDETDDGNCPSSSQGSNPVLRSVSEQHPCSKYGRDILALVSNQENSKTSSEECETPPPDSHSGSLGNFGDMLNKSQLDFKDQADSGAGNWSA